MGRGWPLGTSVSLPQRRQRRQPVERGWLWVSAADGVHMWSADGERLGHIPIGTTVSNLCFGGSDGRRLFIAAGTRLLAIDLLADA